MTLYTQIWAIISFFLLIDGIYAKISNINIIKQKHLVRLCHDFELFVKFKIYKIKWYGFRGGWEGGRVGGVGWLRQRRRK